MVNETTSATDSMFWHGATAPAYSVQWAINSTDDTAKDANPAISWSASKSAGLHPVLYFKYIKSKFNMIERHKIDQRLKQIEAAFDEAAANGQDLLAEKFLNALNLAAKESLLYAKGVTKYIDRDVLQKYKNKIRGGHISNTMLKDFTRVIPKKHCQKINTVKDIFDGIEIWHYHNEDAMRAVEKKQKMSQDEKSKMRDPVAFGLIKGSNNMYFITEWDDIHCDLSFEEIIAVVGKKEQVKHVITKTPKLV